MKALIPVAGEGTRLRPHTHTLPKVLLEVAGKPIVGHILDELEILGIKDVVLIIGYLGQKVVDYVKSNYDFNLEVVEQKERLGLGHAIYLAQNKFNDKDSDVLIILGDTVFQTDFSEVLRGSKSSIGVKEVRDPRRFGVVEVHNGRIKRFIEKPDQPISNLAIVGIYYLNNIKLLFASLEQMIKQDKRTKGEFQLTDALQAMLEQGHEMRTFLVDGWYDCGKPETILETNRHLLSLNSQVREIDGSIIIEPAYIAATATIEDAIIGPDVSVGEYSFVKRSIIRNSIVNRNAIVKNVVLEGSLVGANALVSGRITRLNVGDSSEVDFG